MATNIVTMSIDKIRDTENLEYNKDIGTDATFSLYHAMHEILCHSAETFIQEDFEFAIIEEDVDSYQQVFHNNWQHVYDMWSEDGPNNVLFFDTDVIILKPVSIFSEDFKHFQMFNFTDPKQTSGPDLNNIYGLKHDKYFNAGVRYYPACMPKEQWDIGWEYAKEWDYSVWGTEQLIFNEMMWRMNPNVNHWLRPELGFQAMNLAHNAIDRPEVNGYLQAWNGIHLNDAKILHLHGTRGAANTVALQWELWKRVTGEEFEFSRVEIVRDASGNITDINTK